MARVTGIGGVFLKSGDPESILQWYHDHLGIEPDEEGGSYSSFTWRDTDEPDRAGRTVWSVFAEDSSYFDPSGSAFMVNFRVDDLDGILSQLSEAGAEVVGGVEEYPFGRFGWVLDPEGRKIELWEPLGEREGEGEEA